MVSGNSLTQAKAKARGAGREGEAMAEEIAYGSGGHDGGDGQCLQGWRYRCTGGILHPAVVAAFGSGAIFCAVSGFRGPNVSGHAVATSVLFALFHGGIYKLDTTSSQLPAEDKFMYRASECLIVSAFKKGLLPDTTLPLLNESALREVQIPPGPRLLILEHVERAQDRDEADRRTDWVITFGDR